MPFKTIIFTLLFVAVTYAQVILSSHRNKYLGLIIPIFNILFALNFTVDEVVKTHSYTILFIYLIPVAINLAIYFSCRWKTRTI